MDASKPFYCDRAFWAIMAWALALRLTVAFCSDFYVDEGFSYFIEHAPLLDILRACRVDAHPPLFYLLSAPTAWLTREPFWLRLPSVMLSLGSLGLVAALAQRVGCSRRLLLLICLLQASAYLVWLNEVELRSNALFEFLTLALVWSGLEASEGKTGVLYRWAALLLPLTNLLGNLTALGVAWGTRSRGWRVFLWPCLGCALSILWLGYSLSGPTSVLRESRFGGSLGAWLDVPSGLLGLGMVPDWSWWRGAFPLAPWSLSWAVMAWLLLARGLWSVFRQGRSGRWIALVFVVPLVALSVLGLWRGGGWFQVRYMMPYAGFFFILVARGTVRAEWVLVPIVVMQIATAGMFPGDSFWWNQSWTAATQFVGARWHEGDKLVVYHPYSLNGFDFYYNHRRVELRYHGSASEVDQPPGPLWLDQIPVTPSALGPQLAEHLGSSRVFLMLSQENDSRVRDWFSQRYDVEAGLQLRSVNSWGNGECYLLRLKSR